MNTEVMFSSATDLWATPQSFFDQLNAEFHFNLDPCATPENAKCTKFFTKEIDGLRQNWGGITSFVTRHTAESFHCGFRRLMKRAGSLIQRLLCSFQHALIRNTFMSTFTTKQRKFAF